VHCNLILLCFKVSPKKHGPTWTRKDVDAADQNQTIRIKLWDEKSDYDVNAGEMVKFTSVLTNSYNGELSLISTKQTSCEVCHNYMYFNRKSVKDFLSVGLINCNCLAPFSRYNSAETCQM